MHLSRRGFLGGLASASLGRALANDLPGPADPRVRCVLPESCAGFERAGAAGSTDVRVFPAVSGWDGAVARIAQRGGLVVFESGAGFSDAWAFDAQRTGLSAAFGLTIEPPVALWSGHSGPPYVELRWPIHVRLRDFSWAVPVRGGETVGTIGEVRVAAFQKLGAGGLLFLGSPVGPSLWNDDPQAQTWFSSLLARR
jgi:hypothetical protein